MLTMKPKIDGDRYYKAMITGDAATALQIEESYGLAGYPPEFVTHALQIAANAAIAERERIAKMLTKGYDLTVRQFLPSSTETVGLTYETLMRNLEMQP